MSVNDRIMKNTEKTNKRSTYHHGDLRADLIEATRQLVEEKGPDHFSVSEACRRAGVSTAAPYKHFKDKHEMLMEVVKEGMIRQREMMVEAVARHPQGSLERIVALGRVYVQFALEETGVFRLIFGLSERHEHEEELTQMGELCYLIVQREVALFDGREETLPQDERRAFLLWSFVHGLSFLQIDGKIEAKKLEYELEPVLQDIAHRVMHD